MATTLVPAATCLGCGCACDDISLTISESAIVTAERSCELGTRWFGDGSTPARSATAGRDVSVDAALDEAAGFLLRAKRPLVVLAPDVSCEAYSEAVACADLLHARLDIAASATMTAAIAIQEQGIATATLGEIRNRADMVVFWGVDPAERFPRYLSRYAPLPAGSHIPDGRRSRTVIAVDIDAARGPLDADRRISLTQSTELDTLTALAAMLAGTRGSIPAEWQAASDLAGHLRLGQYVAVVADATDAYSAPARTRGLLALGRALNAGARGAVSLLRDGGNRNGAESVMTSHTGYPGAIDFSSGVPKYRPHAARELRHHDAVLWIGAATHPAMQDVWAFSIGTTVAIGPALSVSALSQALVVIDSGKAGVHSAGTAVRMDDVPIPLKQVVPGPPDAADLCRSLRQRLVSANAHR